MKKRAYRGEHEKSRKKWTLAAQYGSGEETWTASL